MNDKMEEASYKHALSGVECVQSVKHILSEIEWVQS